MSSLLRTEKLTKRFKGLLANDDINMEIFDGDVRCIIGPNGAGKTTLFNVIAGIHKPTSGHIFLNQTESFLSFKLFIYIFIKRKFHQPNILCIVFYRLFYNFF